MYGYAARSSDVEFLEHVRDLIDRGRLSKCFGAQRFDKPIQSVLILLGPNAVVPVCQACQLNG